MNRALLILIIITALIVVTFLAMGLYSGTGSAPGLLNGQLSSCPNTPNCVSSESAPADKHAIAAIAVTPTMGDEPLLKVKEVIELLGGDVKYTDEGYMASTFSSEFFGFVDDVEFRYDQSSDLVHVRSASRVGYSDMGANRRRVEQIRQLLNVN